MWNRKNIANVENEIYLFWTKYIGAHLEFDANMSQKS